MVVNLSHSSVSCSGFVNFSITFGFIFELLMFSPFRKTPSLITISIPNEPYQIVLDGGPGEKVIKEGVFLKGENIDNSKINPKVIEKLTKPEHETEEWDKLTTILFSMAFILFLLTIYFSARNSNKILSLIYNGLFLIY
jgi:hypothetical protein